MTLAKAGLTPINGLHLDWSGDYFQVLSEGWRWSYLFDEQMVHTEPESILPPKSGGVVLPEEYMM
jgi:hypothetical protein